MENLNKSQFSQNCIRIIKGSFISIIITLVMLFIFSILLTFTGMKESLISPVVIIITAVSILIGSSISTLKVKKNGLINGGCIGLIYILFIYLLSSIMNSGFSFNVNSVIMIICSILAGMLGGIIGINLK